MYVGAGLAGLERKRCVPLGAARGEMWRNKVEYEFLVPNLTAIRERMLQINANAIAGYDLRCWRV